MSRITYLELPAIFIGALILACLFMLGWTLLLIPAMLSKKVRNLGGIQNRLMVVATKGMMRSAMKGMAAR